MPLTAISGGGSANVPEDGRVVGLADLQRRRWRRKRCARSIPPLRPPR